MTPLAKKSLLLRVLLVVLLLLVSLPVALLWADDWVLLHRQQMLAWWPDSGLLYALVHDSIWIFYLAYAGLAVYALWRRRGDLAFVLLCYFVAQLVISVLLVRFLKMSIGRPRPEFFGQPWTRFSGQAAFASLPSGHTADAAVGVGIADTFTSSRLWRYLAFLLMFVTAFGRVVEGKHYPSDVLVAAALAYLAALFLARLLGIYAARLLPARLHVRWLSEKNDEAQ